MENNKPKIGLALGGGGSRGLAHIGVIKVLEKQGVPIDYIAGTSIGALVGGLYAYFQDAGKLEEIFLIQKWQKVFSLVSASLRGGFLSQKKLEKYLQTEIGRINIQDLKIPFIAITVDLLRGKEVKLAKGDLIQAMMASIAIPIVFKPVVYEKKVLVDGGLINPIPVDTVKTLGADSVIAVNLQSKYFVGRKPDLFNYGMRALEIFEYQLSREQLKKADVVIEPAVGYVGWDRFIKPKEIIAKGETAALAHLQEIKRLLK